MAIQVIQYIAATVCQNMAAAGPGARKGPKRADKKKKKLAQAAEGQRQP